MSTTLHQLKKGVTTLIVLDALEKGSLYGYGLRREIHERTRGTLQFSEGALYPLLHSLAKGSEGQGQRVTSHKSQIPRIGATWAWRCDSSPQWLLMIPTGGCQN